MLFCRKPNHFYVFIACIVSILSSLTLVKAQDANNVEAKVFNEILNTAKLATDAFAKGSWEEAATYFDKVISSYQGLPEEQKKAYKENFKDAYFSLGAAYFNAKNYDKTIPAFQKFIANYPTDSRLANAEMALAQSYFVLQQYTESVDFFKKMEKYPSQRDFALKMQGACYALNKDEVKAKQAYQSLVSKGISNSIQADGALQLINILLNKKEFTEAESLLQQVLKKKQYVTVVLDLNNALLRIGDYCFEAKEYDKAIDLYAKVQTPDQIINNQQNKIDAITNSINQNNISIKNNPNSAQELGSINQSLNNDLEQAKQLLAEFKKLPNYSPALLMRQSAAWSRKKGLWQSILIQEKLLNNYPKSPESEEALFSNMVSYAELNLIDEANKNADLYIKNYPKGKFLQQAYILKSRIIISQSDDKADSSNSLLALIQQAQKTAVNIEELYILLAASYFNENELEKSAENYTTYLQKFPEGTFAVESAYRLAIIPLFLGKYEEAYSALKIFIEKHPNSEFTADARYRFMVTKYSASLYEEIIADAKQWLTDYPSNSMKGEVLSTQADAYAAMSEYDTAVEIYLQASRSEPTKEVSQYVLGEASKILYKNKKMDEIAKIWQEQLNSNQDPDFKSLAIYWISRSKTSLGQTDEAKKIIVEQLSSVLEDRNNESAELLLNQLIQLCYKRPKVKKTDVNPTSPETVTPWDGFEELNKTLLPLSNASSTTGNARLNFAKSEMLKIQKKLDTSEQYLSIVASTDSSKLSPQLLACSGDFLQRKNLIEAAKKHYSELITSFPKNQWIDFAYNGLGYIELHQNKNYEEALKYFNLVIDEYSGLKLKDSTLGKAITMLKQEKFDEAKKLFEQIAGTKEWRGESTAEAIFQLGEVQRLQKNYEEAIVHYQRVFVAYQKYPRFVAEAYLKAAECFNALNKKQEAVAHLREMIKNEKIGDPMKNKAKVQLQEWGESL